MLISLVSLLAVAVVANVIVFYIAYKQQTDKLTDITYSATFVLLATLSLLIGQGFQDSGNIIIALLVIIWGVRLGSFLLLRIKKMGHDSRFDKIRPNKSRFFRFFLIQGFGAWLISLPMMIRLLKGSSSEMLEGQLLVERVGIAVAVIGLMIEVIADQQKSTFKSTRENESKLYTGGLYSFVRYPNYLGEILFWIGIFIASSIVFQGVEWASIIGPLCISYLLLFLSGIPFIERSRKEKYGEDESYQKYQSSTAKIIPWIY